MADATGDDRFARDPYFGRSQLLLAAGRADPAAAARSGPCWCSRTASSAARSPRSGSTRCKLDRRANSPSRSTTPSCTPSSLRSRARIVAAADQARRRIGRDLHDGAQQRLVHTILTLKLAQPRARRRGRAGSRSSSDEALENAERALHETARAGTRPPSQACLSSGGLAPALDALAGRSADPRDVRPSHRRPAARARRGDRVLRRLRGADQCGQALELPPSWKSPSTRSTVRFGSRSATTASAVPT